MPRPASTPSIFSTSLERFEVVLETEPAIQAPRSETPFRIALLGDFSGCAHRGPMGTGPALPERPPVLVDRDNLDEVLAGLGVELRLPSCGEESPGATVRFHQLDDFHPDQLYARLPLFESLRRLKASHAAGEPQTGTKAGATPEAPPPESLIEGSLLDRVLDEAGRPAADHAASARDELQEFVNRIVAPHLAPTPGREKVEMSQRIDAAIGSQMRSLLHNPDFQALESAWRAVFLLVRRLETDVRLKLYLIDVSKAELAADLLLDRDMYETGIYKLLVESSTGAPGGEPWAVLCGNYTFGTAAEDLELLGRLAQIAQASGAPWISAADSSLMGCTSIAATPDPDDWSPEPEPLWEELRRLPEARYLGLALPRFLLRLPYGKESDPCEQIDFEEMEGAPGHENYVWGNPAFACTLLLGQAFQLYGWNFRPGACRDVDNLPLHVDTREGETQVKPCAEAMLTERAAEHILERGLMPLVWLKGSDAVRVVRFQSVSYPLAALAGRWEGASA